MSVTTIIVTNNSKTEQQTDYMAWREVTAKLPARWRCIKKDKCAKEKQMQNHSSWSKSINQQISTLIKSLVNYLIRNIFQNIIINLILFISKVVNYLIIRKNAP